MAWCRPRGRRVPGEDTKAGQFRARSDLGPAPQQSSLFRAHLPSWEGWHDARQVRRGDEGEGRSSVHGARLREGCNFRGGCPDQLLHRAVRMAQWWCGPSRSLSCGGLSVWSAAARLPMRRIWRSRCCGTSSRCCAGRVHLDLVDGHPGDGAVCTLIGTFEWGARRLGDAR